MGEFNFNSQICTDKNQSERLLALGLKKVTADMVWHFTNSRSLAMQWELNPHPPVTKNNCHFNIDRLNAFGRKNSDGTLMTGEEYFNEVWGKDIPAWSLHRLIEMIPENVSDDWLGVSFDEVSYYHVTGDGMIGWEYYKVGNIYDCIIECYEWLIKEGYFNKEYLV